jgi:hypothetical protein
MNNSSFLPGYKVYISPAIKLENRTFLFLKRQRYFWQFWKKRWEVEEIDMSYYPILVLEDQSTIFVHPSMADDVIQQIGGERAGERRHHPLYDWTR